MVMRLSIAHDIPSLIFLFKRFDEEHHFDF